MQPVSENPRDASCNFKNVVTHKSHEIVIKVSLCSCTHRHYTLPVKCSFVYFDRK